MGKQMCYFLFMLWLCYLIVSSVLLFTRGFLLTRVAQKYNSTCELFVKVPCPIEESLVNNNTNEYDQCSYNEKLLSVLTEINVASSVCLPQKAKVILLIVDALRYDFTVYDESLKHPLPFQNKLPVINRLLKQAPDSSRLYKFIADPPTTTMQRLKALTTGSLPTFIDAGSNFATSEINEDNIIDQLIENNHSIVFMGDDTWNGLYPNRFIRNYPYPSFNVWDLDTVDNGVKENLFPELNKTDWSLLIGHFLGVDHCGHRYGPNHPEMSRKLTEIDAVIYDVTEQMDENSILFVIGDHGMTVTGDHGGESEDEITAGMFVYSKQPLTNVDPGLNKVKQVNLVPTLSTILGIPIPFQNLGVLILNCLPITNKTMYIQEWQLSLYSLWSNVQQFVDYIKQYSRNTKTFNEDILKTYYEKYSILRSKLIRVSTEHEFVDFSQEVVEYLTNLRSMCEGVWIQFDSFSMTRGLLFIFLSLFFVFIIIDGIPSHQLPEIFLSSFILCSYIALGVAASVATILFYLNVVDNLISTIFFSTGLVSQFMLVMLVIQNWEVISLNWYDKSRKNRITNLICRLVLVFNLCGLFSNSYIIEESFVLLFLLVTVILVGTVGIGSTNVPEKKKTDTGAFRWPKIKLIILAFAIAALVRTSKYFWRCREEQQWCFASPHDLNTITSKVETTKLQWAITVVCLAIFVFISKVWLRNCGNLNGYSVTVTLAKYVPTVMVVCTAGYWVLQRLPSNTKKPIHTVNILAWAVYGFTFIGICSTILKPLCIYVLPRKQEIAVDSDKNIIPQIFKKMKGTYSNKQDSNDDVPIVCGLGTVYSAVYIIIGIYLTLLFGLLLGDAAAPSAVVMFLTAAFVLIITSVLRIERATTVEQLFEIPHVSILVWVILSQYFFYGSGHQPAFPNISWEAAFVGTTGTFTYNIIPGTLIIINTFCSYILMGFLLPLLVITPFTIFVMLPSLLGKKHDLLRISQRGEVALYERDELMVTTMFTVCCKYITCHGIRVFASMLAATIHCRHLMVWKIFAPKMIFESIGMFVTLASVILGYLVLLRVNKKVDSVIAYLNKLS